jgi:hypothetical protein
MNRITSTVNVQEGQGRGVALNSTPPAPLRQF